MNKYSKSQVSKSESMKIGIFKVILNYISRILLILIFKNLEVSFQSIEFILIET